MLEEGLFMNSDVLLGAVRSFERQELKHSYDVIYLCLLSSFNGIDDSRFCVRYVFSFFFFWASENSENDSNSSRSVFLNILLHVSSVNC